MLYKQWERKYLKVLNRYKELEIKKVTSKMSTQEEEEYKQIGKERIALLDECVAVFVREQ